MEAGTSGFVSISDSDRRVPAELGQESHASSCKQEWNYACLSSYSRGDRQLVELCLESAGFSYNVEKSRMVGYQAKFEPLDSFFDSIDELKSYAIRTEDDKELFSTIARNSITRFIEQKDGASLRLFFPITFPELDYVNRTFAYISSINEANIVLILNEDELLNLPKESITALVDIIMTFKSKGYEVALLLNDKETALNSTVYEVFDYFLLSVASHVTDRKSQSRQIPSFQALVEKLLRYNKPIIAIDIPSLSLVEYIIKLGVTIVGSDSIAPFDENVLPLNKKILMKLKNMN